MARLIFELRGRVQGVGFRDHVVALAQRFSVHGTVCNLRVGTLEIDVQGELEEIEAFIGEVVTNPPRHGLVEGIGRSAAEPRPIEGFSRAPTR